MHTQEARDALDVQAAWDYIHNGYLLAPRTVLKGLTKFPQFIPLSSPVDLNKPYFGLEEKLLAAMSPMAGLRRLVMFSGGFDSLLIASLAQRSGAQVTAITIQLDDFNSLTVQGAVQVAKKAGIAHHVLHVKTMEFFSAFEALAGITNEPVMDLDLAVIHAAFKKYNHAIAGNVMIHGMGSDQWFGNDALKGGLGGLAVRLNSDMVSQDAHQQIAQAHESKFVFPFLSKSMLSLSQSIPADMKKNKKLLRSLALSKGIVLRGCRSQTQFPSWLRHMLVKIYGGRAWPTAISHQNRDDFANDRLLRQIVLGLWLKKRAEKHPVL